MTLCSEIASTCTGGELVGTINSSSKAESVLSDAVSLGAGTSVTSAGTTKGGTSGQATKLLRAAADGDVEQVMRILTSTKAGVNTLRARGSTALHEAAKAGHLQIVKELLSRNAEVNAVNRSGCTALHFAALCKNKLNSLEGCEALLDAGAAVNVQSERMDTPLHFAAYCPDSEGCKDSILALLKRRAMLNARNKNSETPLINAVLNNNASVVELLMEHGADVAQRNNMDKSAHDIAAEKGYAVVTQVLEKMKDPMLQLADITQQMRTALSQMQTVDMLSQELGQQSAMTDAYEGVALSAISELDQDGRARLVEGALSALRGSLVPAKAASGAVASVPASLEPRSASMPATQHRVLQALVTLLLISRGPRGSALLYSMGVLEALPFAEQQAAHLQTGHKELRELRANLQKAQTDATTTSVMSDCSDCSTPSSFTGGDVASQHNRTPGALSSLGGSSYPLTQWRTKNHVAVEKSPQPTLLQLVPGCQDDLEIDRTFSSHSTPGSLGVGYASSPPFHRSRARTEPRGSCSSASSSGITPRVSPRESISPPLSGSSSPAQPLPLPGSVPPPPAGHGTALSAVPREDSEWELERMTESAENSSIAKAPAISANTRSASRVFYGSRGCEVS